MKKIMSGVIVLAIAAIALGVYLSQRGAVEPESMEETTTIEGWQTYSNSAINFSLAYPPEMDVREFEQGVTFTMWGPTQTLDTEMYDGISVTITAANVTQTTNLEEVATALQEDSAQHGNIVEHATPVRVGRYDGYKYVLEGLGAITTVVLSPRENMFVTISYLAPDPDGRGYQATVDTMLESLSF